MTFNQTLVCTLLAAAAGAAQAQAEAPAPAPAHVPELPLWEFGVAGAGASTPAYPGSSDRSRRAAALPFVIYRGEVFRADQSGIGARLVRKERVELDVGLAASLPADSDDVEARRGMPNLGTLLELGPRLKVLLAEPSESSRVRLDLPLRAVIEARGGLRGQGWTFEPKVVYEMRDRLWTFDANVGVVMGNRKINRYFYQVDQQYATLERPAYEADSGLMLVRTGMSASRLLNPDLRVFGFVRYESYADAANRASPLVKQSTGSSFGMGFAWTITRSTRMAVNK